jgi:hypothetical protein
MPDSPKQSNAGHSEIELKGRQMTLDDWAHVLQAIPRPTETRSSTNGDVGAVAVQCNDDEPPSHVETGSAAAPHRRSATELLKTPGALLTRSHLRELGLERRAIDAVFRKLAVVFLPGYSRPMVRVEDYLELIQEFTYRGDRVRPIAKAS